MVVSFNEFVTYRLYSCQSIKQSFQKTGLLRCENENGNFNPTDTFLMDPAILIRGPPQLGNRIRYSRMALLALRDTQASTTRPNGWNSGGVTRNIWKQKSTLDDKSREGRNKDKGGGIIAGQNAITTSTLNVDSSNKSNSDNGSTSMVTSTASSPSSSATTSSSNLLQLLTAKCHPPDAAKELPKPEPQSSHLTSLHEFLRGNQFGNGNYGAGFSANIGSFNEHDNHIGNDPMSNLEYGWNYRSTSISNNEKKSASATDYNYRSSGNFLDLNPPDHRTRSPSFAHQQHFNQHQFGHRDRDHEYPDRRFDRRSYGHDRDKSHAFRGNRSNNIGNSFGNPFFSQPSKDNTNHNYYKNDRRRIYSENHTEEPEWFSCGPTSKHDVIELRGFDDPDDSDTISDAPKSGNDNDSETVALTNDQQSNNTSADLTDGDRSGITTPATSHGIPSVETSPPARSTPSKMVDINDNGESKALEEMDNDSNPQSSNDFNFEKFLNMDLISDLLEPDEVDKDTKGSDKDAGESKFSHWFKPDKQNDIGINRQSSLQNDLNNLIGHSRDGSQTNKYVPPMFPDSTSGSTNSFLNFLHRGNFAKYNQSGQIHNVEELEANIRTGGLKKPNQQQQIRNSQQQDLLAFRNILAQLQNQQRFHQNNFQQQQHQVDALKRAIHFGQQLQQNRMELLNNPEAQALIQSINRGEISQKTLLQRLSNPNANSHQREIIMAVLSMYNNATVSQQQHQFPTKFQQSTNDVIRSHLLALQRQQAAQKQLRASPLLSGNSPRIPTPRELQLHTQTIMQNAINLKNREKQAEYNRHEALQPNPQQNYFNQQNLVELFQQRQQQQRSNALRSYLFQQLISQQQQATQQTATNLQKRTMQNTLSSDNETNSFIRKQPQASNSQLERWFSPELLAKASAGKLPPINHEEVLSSEEFEKTMQRSAETVND